MTKNPLPNKNDGRETELSQPFFQFIMILKLAISLVDNPHGYGDNEFGLPLQPPRHYFIGFAVPYWQMWN